MKKKEIGDKFKWEHPRTKVVEECVVIRKTEKGMVVMFADKTILGLMVEK